MKKPEPRPLIALHGDGNRWVLKIVEPRRSFSKRVHGQTAQSGGVNGERTTVLTERWHYREIRLASNQPMPRREAEKLALDLGIVVTGGKRSSIPYDVLAALLRAGYEPSTAVRTEMVASLEEFCDHPSTHQLRSEVIAGGWASAKVITAAI